MSIEAPAATDEQAELAPDAQGDAPERTPAATKAVEYVVFAPGVGTGDERVWTELGSAFGKTKSDALEAIVSQLPADEQDGPFRAVASRYWVESIPTVEEPPPPKRIWT